MPLYKVWDVKREVLFIYLLQFLAYNIWFKKKKKVGKP